ncbi:endoplasmic reticulum metallopeptidase 1-like [Uranotaenia lowii]|uniref:endoplasmic reticulum metallopeptidase 1-like n=1 Tax=Uranotaenia lowii TaxID=190385 RepID=UPI00247A2A71|nr:endoplasmic reticulum metallopeptidase 1-like [Uranotaenia lowii]
MVKNKRPVSKTERFKVDSDSGNVHRVEAHWSWLVLALVLGAGSVTNYFLTHLPEARTVADLERFDGIFIAERAWQDLKAFSDLGPRVVGSKENEALAVDIFNRRIEEIRATCHPDQKVVVENQIVTGVFNFTFYGTSMTTMYRNVQNIVVKLEGEREESLLLNCHYDTVPGSPGASDDVASCSVMLEILRVMSRSPQKNLYSVVFLFNGAEETLLQASHGFITKHPWASQIKAFLNLESAGSAGKEILFQSGPNSPWLVDAYAKSVRHPFAQAMAEELFRTGLIPSDTDFRIFRDYGKISGIDLAHFLNGYRYHTRYDSLEYLSLPVLQRTGDNVLALTLEIVNSNHLSENPQSPPAPRVFYDFLGLVFISYSSRTGHFINALVAVLAVLIPYRGLSGRRASIRVAAFRGFGATLAGALLGLATNSILARQMEILDGRMAWYSNLWLVLPMYGAPALICHCVVQMLLDVIFANKKTTLSTGATIQARLIGVNAFWSAVVILLSLAGFRSGYIFMIIQLCSLASVCLNIVLKLQRSSRAWILVHLAFQFVAAVWSSFYYLVFVKLFAPIAGRSGSVVNPDFIIGTIAVLGVLLTGSYLLPLFGLVRRPNRVLAQLCGLALFGLALALLTPLGFPYRDASGGEPTTQRHLVTHTMRFFHDEQGLLKDMDKGFLFEAQDINGARSLRQIFENEDLVPVEQMPSCKTDFFCALPFDAMWRQVHFDQFWLPTEDFPVTSNMFTLAFNGTETVSGNLRRVTFVAEGSIQSAFYVGPKPGVKLVRWSLLDSVAPPVRFNNQDGYFVYISHGLPDRSWPITMDFEVQDGHAGSIVDIGVITKYWESHDTHTDEFRALLEKFPAWTNVVPSVAVINVFEL